MLSLRARADIPGLTSMVLYFASYQANPNYMVVGADGNSWFTDPVNKAVGKLVISSTGATATLYPLMPALPAGQTTIGDVGGIALGPDHAVWFSMTSCAGLCVSGGQSYLGRVTPDGRVTLIPNAGGGDARMGMIAGPDGNFYYSGSPNPLIVRVTPQGTVTQFRTPSGGVPGGPVVGPDMNLWFGELNGSSSMIGKMTTTGMFTEYPLPSGDYVGNCEAVFSCPIALGSDGNFWYGDGRTNSIGRMTPSGAVTEYPIPSPDASPSAITPAPDGNIYYAHYFDATIGRVTINRAMPNGNPTIDEQKLPNTFGHGRQLLNLPPGIGNINFVRNGSDRSRGTNLTHFTVPAAAALPPFLQITKEQSFYGFGGFGPKTTYYTLRVKNVGLGPTTGPIQVSDVLPLEFKYIKLWRDCTIPDAFTHRVSCQIDEILQKDEEYYTVLAGALDAPDGSTINNQAQVSGGGDPIPHQSNIVSITLGKAILSVTKNHEDLLGQLQWTITVTNAGKASTDGPVTVTDTLPQGVVLKPFGDLLGGTCNLAGGVVTCQSSAALGAGKSLKFPLPIDKLPNGDLSNKATATAAGADPATSEPDVISVRRGQVTTNPPPQLTNGR